LTLKIKKRTVHQNKEWKGSGCVELKQGTEAEGWLVKKKVNGTMAALGGC